MNVGYFAVGIGPLAEATWALNYWAAPFLLGGALLLVIFYVAIGLLQHHLEGTLSRRVFWASSFPQPSGNKTAASISCRSQRTSVI